MSKHNTLQINSRNDRAKKKCYEQYEGSCLSFLFSVIPGKVRNREDLKK